MVFNILALFPGSVDNEIGNDEDQSSSTDSDESYLEERINDRKVASTSSWYSASVTSLSAAISASVGSILPRILRRESCKEKACKTIESDWPEILEMENKQQAMPADLVAEFLNVNEVCEPKVSPVVCIRTETHFAKPKVLSQSGISESVRPVNLNITQIKLEEEQQESEKAMLAIEEAVRQGEMRRQNRRMQSDHDHEEWRSFLAETGLGQSLGIDC